MGVEVERQLSRRELNRAVLARQSLLRRAPVTIPEALRQIAGQQAQYAPAMYLGLWSRVADLTRGAVTEGLERRDIVQGTLMRSTIHLVAASDYWPFAVGLRAARRAWYRRAWRDGPSERELVEAASRLRAALRAGPMRRAEIDALLGPRRLEGVGLWLDLVRVPPAGTWERRRADLYAAATDWLGAADVSPEEGLDLVVRRYLGGFGPASRADIATWAGMAVRDLSGALDRLPLRRFRAEDGTELLDLPDAPLPSGDTPAPVRFLPTWDATLLVHARRSGILPEEYRTRVFSSRNPHSFPTVLVDGSVAGTWRYERGKVEIEEFAPLSASVRREVQAEAERLAEFHA